ncbi:MAG: nitrilase-related carbon-nitrogen hydrolase [bacterium]|nr:hypothetical protein [bacterium]MBU1917722.1 hypothetical protein [bacterium]
MKNKKLKIAFVQNDPQNNEFFKNQKPTMMLIDEAMALKPDLVMLPEMFLSGPRKISLRKDFCLAYNDFLTALKIKAKQERVCFFGSYYAKINKRVGNPISYANRAFFLNHQGKISGYYDKIHLFSLDGEDKVFAPGRKAKNIMTPWGRVAPLICYDIRFPELLRALTCRGAVFSLVSAQWPASRIDHWLMLLQARAIENQIFVIACNRVGKKGRLSFNGHSCVISPWGEVLLCLTGKQRVGACTIDLDQVTHIRKAYPFFQDAQTKRFRFDF